MAVSITTGCTKNGTEGLGDLSSTSPVASPNPAPSPSENENPNVMDLNALESKDFGDSPTYGQLKMNSQEEFVAAVASKLTVFSKGGKDKDDDDDDKGNSGKGNGKDDKDKDDDDRDWDNHYGKGKDDDYDHKKRCRKFFSRNGRKYKDCQEPTFTSVKINIKEVSAYNEAVGWVLLNGTPQTVDLIQISSNANIILVDRRIPPGSYKQIRIKIDGNATGILDNSKTVSIKVPSGDRSGIKLRHEFNIEKGLITLISLNFDPERSIKELGKSGKYIMHPHIRINGIEEDLVIPAIAILSPSERYSNNLVQLIEVEYGDANLNLSSLSVKVNGVEVKSSLAVDEVTAKGSLTFVEGEHTISASISDLAPNFGVANPVVVTIDKTPPTLTLNNSYILSKNKLIHITANALDPLSGLDQGSYKLFINDIQTSTTPLIIGSRYLTSIELNEGDHQFRIAIKDKAGNESTVTGTVRIDLTPPSLSLTNPIFDGSIYTNILPKTFDFYGVSSEPLTHVSINGVGSILTPDANKFSSTLEITAAGMLPVEIRGEDLAGNQGLSNGQVNVIFDNIAPVISFGIPNNQRTRYGSHLVPIKVEDSSPTWTKIKLNGVEILQTGSKDFEVLAIPLNEGPNQIEVATADAAGNQSVTTTLVIVKDSQGPVLTFVSPRNGDIVNGILVNVQISSNEPLEKLTVNEYPAQISGQSASVQISIPTPGNVDIIATAEDDLGNTTTERVAVFSVINALNPSLISAFVDSDINKIRIMGAVGSVRPGLSLKVSTGFFDSQTISPELNGSFYIEMNSAPDVSFSVYDPQTDQTYRHRINFVSQIETLFSGQVRSTDDEPLAGVKVRILGTNLQTTTNEHGVFIFSNSQFPDSMVYGDRKVEIDGTTTAPRPTLSPRVYAKTVVPVSIGLAQTNVLQTPIYLGFTRVDDGIEVNRAAGATISDPVNAPGFQITIPPNAANFPLGGTSAVISMERVLSERTSVPPPESAIPKYVVSLEPSGAKFSEPVELIMPNPNEFPPGTELVIMSLNSDNGLWEVGGAAKVSENGQEIKTKPGMGIRHFSPHYATIPGPMILPIGNEDSPGANLMKGAQARSISIPSFKVLGEDMNLTLQYNSTWAKPSVVVTNIIDFGKPQVVADFKNTSAGGLYTTTRKHCEVIAGELNCFDSEIALFDSYKFEDFFQNVTAEIQPLEVETFFETASIRTPSYRYSNLPQWANLPIFTDLKDESGYLASGSYPYRTKTNIKFKELVLGTVTRKAWSQTQDARFPTEIQTEFETEVEKVTNQDLNGSLYVQNYRNSPVGKGWRIAGLQNIVNPNADRIMLEEIDASVSSYSLSNSIETVFNGAQWNGDLRRGADIARFPKVGFRYGNQFAEIDTSTSNGGFRVITNEAPMSGQFWTYSTYNIFFFQGPFLAANTSCHARRYPYEVNAYPNQFLVDNTGNLVLADSGRNLATLHQPSGQFIHMAGEIGYLEPPVKLTNNYFVAADTLIQDAQDFCQNGYPQYPGFKCGTPTVIGPFLFPRATFCGDQFPLPFIPTSQRPFPTAGNSPRQLNNPIGISKGRSPGSYVVADFGNNQIKLVSPSSGGISQVIAGNGGSADLGDGLPATQASLNHPRFAFYDSTGNLYISTISKVWMVDQTGIIHHIAGNPNGMLANESDAKEAKIESAAGMALDEANRILYVADYGRHRVLRIDLDRGRASTVAGNSVAGFSGDGKPALDAQLNGPTFLAIDENRNLLVVDSGNNRVRRINFNSNSNGVLTYSPTSEDKSLLIRTPTGFERTLRNGNRSYFDLSGKHLRSIDRAGNEVKFSYNGDGLLAQIETPDHQVITFSYNSGMLTSITDPAGRQTNLEHDHSNHLTKVRYPDASIQQYQYDQDGLLTTDINERGKITRTEFNQFDRIQKVIHPDLTEVVVQDLDSANLKDVDFNGINTPTGPIGGNLSVQDGRQITTRVVPNRFGLPRGVLDSANRKSEFVTDPDGRITKIIRQDGSYFEYQYHPVTNDIVSVFDSKIGAARSTVYDSFGQKISETDFKGKTTSRTHHPTTGLLLATVGPTGDRVDYVTGIYGLITSRTITANGTTVTTNLERNNRGLVTKEILPGGTEILITYDLAGNVTSTSTKLSETKTLTKQFEYTLRNKLKKIISPKGEETTYNYLSTGELSEIVDSKGKVTKFFYDDRGRLLRRELPSGEIHQLAYDQNSNLIREIDPKGNEKVITYNEFNKPTRIQLADDLIEMAYDTSDRLTSISNAVSMVSYQYNTQDFVTKMSWSGRGSLSDFPSYFIEDELDQHGRILSSTTPLGQRTNTFDTQGRLTNLVSSSGQGAFAFEYDQLDRISRILRPGSSTQFAFNPKGLVAAISHKSSAVVRSKTELEYDNRNLPNLTRTLAGAFTSNYDDNGFLTSHQNVNGSENWTYDSLGNRVSTQDVLAGGGESIASYSYDSSSQRLVDDGNYIYGYDLNGNIIFKNPKRPELKFQSFSYNSKNQLTKVQFLETMTGPMIEETEYVYDVLGQRIQQKYRKASAPLEEQIRRYWNHDSEVFAEFDGANSLLAEYTHSKLVADDILSMKITQAGVNAGLSDALGTFYFLKNHIGSVTDIVNAAGEIVQHYEYSAFGKVLKITDGVGTDVTQSPKIMNRFTFTGREYDEQVNLYYYRARYLDPEIGRFLQVDPHPGDLGDPVSVTQKYSYARNAPTILTDPSGMSWLSEVTGIDVNFGNIFQDIGNAIHNFVANLGAAFDTLVKSEGFKKGVVIAAAFAIGFFLAPALIGLGLPSWASSSIAILASGTFSGAAYVELKLGSFEEGFQIGIAAGGIGVGVAQYSGAIDAATVNVNASSRGILIAENASGESFSTVLREILRGKAASNGFGLIVGGASLVFISGVIVKYGAASSFLVVTVAPTLAVVGVITILVTAGFLLF